MDPFVVFDCEKFLPKRFSLALAAAARCRALHRGAEPRSRRPAASASDLALCEIADGAFSPADLALLLGEANETRLCSPSALPELCSGASAGLRPPPARSGRTDLLNKHTPDKENERC